MNRKLFIFASVLLLAAALPRMAGAGQMVLEMDPHKLLAEEAGLKKCDNLHQTTGDCICCNWHVESTPEETAALQSSLDPTERATTKLIGSRIKLRNVNRTLMVRVDRVTPLYRLDSGATFTPTSDWNPRDASGERWISEHAGIHKNRIVASWNDLNRDGLVGVADELVFDNGELAKIVNVGVALHVTTEGSAKPAPVRPAAQQ